jgi:RecG-like helicase
VAPKKGLAGAVHRLATPVEELDREQLRDFCDALGLTPSTEVQSRQHVCVGGEVRSVRVVPRAGAPALEVSVNDGLGSVTAVFLGRSNIAGITPGRHITVDGVVGKYGKRFLIYNPTYTLLP